MYRRAVIHALDDPPRKVAWAADLLLPLLDDSATFGWTNGKVQIRVCDEAAGVLIQHLEGAHFEMEHGMSHSALDIQIKAIKQSLAK